MNDSSTLRSISWLELCPWLILFRSFRISLGLTAMLAALVGALLMPIGWKVSSALFLGDERLERNVELRQVDQRLSSIHRSTAATDTVGHRIGLLPGSMLHGQAGDWSATFDRLATGYRNLFSTKLELTEFAYFVFGTLWSLAVWAFCGGVIVRQAIVKLSVGERLPIRLTVTHTAKKFVSYLCAPLFPLIAVVLIAIPIAVVGLIMRAGDGGALVAAVLWIFVLIGGLIMAVTLLGLLFGWPLMWGAIAAEQYSDTFDAVSRAYSYVFQKPLHYLFYAVVASLFGALCWILADGFGTAVIELSWWAASFGAGDETINKLRPAIDGFETQEGFTAVWASAFVLWEGLVHLLVSAFRYSFFWTAAAAIYLLLRYDADRTEIDEVYLEEDEQPHELPTLDSDDRGVPKAPEAPEDEEES